MSRFTALVRTLIPVLLSGAVCPVAAADDAAAIRAARERHIGPAIVGGSGYTVHSPQAVAAGAGLRCVLPQGTAMSDAEYTARRDAVLKPLFAEQETLRKDKTALMIAQRSPSRLPPEDYRARVNALNDRESAVAEKIAAEDRKLQDEQRSARLSAARPLMLYVMHTPADPGRTIVPMNGLYPSQEFVAELNRLLRPFLATCGDTEWAGTSHYYRDAMPFGMSSATQIEPAILAYGYTLRAGTLTVKPAVENEVWKMSRDAARNPRITLAGLLAENHALSAEQSRRNADYRKDHLVAARRKPGIVYKLDSHWERYRRPELARRIFDGDFARYANTVEFRALFVGYASLYSTRCKDHVQSFTALYDTVTENHRSEQDPGTGIFVPKSDTRIVPNRIDSRFAGLYQSYEGDLANAYMARILGQMQEAGRGERPGFANMTAAGFADAVRGEVQYMQGLAGVFPEFFEQHLCTSAAMTQMGENILRASQGKPALQEAGVALANAERESDPPRR